MKIIDESEQIRSLAEQAFAGPRPGRPGALEVLREASYAAAAAGETAQAANGNPGRSIAAAVDAYQYERRVLIAYRLRNGLPTEGGDSDG